MLALHRVLTGRLFDIPYLLTSFSEKFNRVSMHGIRKELLAEQVKQLGIPLYELILPEMTVMANYEHEMGLHIKQLQKEGVTHNIFGDIFLKDLREYREEQFGALGMEVVFPLWEEDSRKLMEQFISLGYKTIVVAARDDLKDFCGRVIDHAFLNELPDGVDPCGENGEYHSFVFDGPLFREPIAFKKGGLVFKEFPRFSGADDELIKGYWYQDLY